ncbi:hypothetical protein [Roseisolibacter agri]|uniref:Uncharacterized protein n=1 Tax=Roseisolibacter agri TaxID=2014610 RepID=A0AA37QJ56_9BACT|nr:hypothetical protein [Roseisolibacter agri]GLC27843.1 hypothetical protein rosag_43560 [Roseisolibacter agri]
MDMDDETSGARWPDRQDWPTSRQRMGAQQAASKLLDALAPERPPARRDEPASQVLRVRSPRGCVLQGARTAVSVSWFPPLPSDAALGELQVIGWRGVVSRPGQGRQAPGSAEAVSTEVLVPVENGVGDAWLWQSADGKQYDVSALTERCNELLADPGQLPARAS